MLSVTKLHKTGKWLTNHLQGHIKPSEHINKQFARWEARERGGWQYLACDRREFITLLAGAISVFLCVSAAAQEGYYVPGNNMKPYGGLTSAEDRARVIVFLESPTTN